mmetsp:Transcript_21593/g.31413  ORF Transcript_21593/g.31413 Transcript_21593/m.31413 type:complete len:340 (+) Transcript_21593:111-1130(+)
MSIFGDEPRFYPDLRTQKNSPHYGKRSTADHIGPGAHFSRELDEKRNGWTPKSPGKREPMTKGKSERDRSDYYISGHLTASGLAVPNSPDRSHYPSPGQYHPSESQDYSLRLNTTLNKTYSSPSLNRPASAGRSTMGSTPRLAPSSTVVKGDVVFSGARDDSLSHRGPGSYFISDSPGSPPTTLLRKSYNSRANSGNTKGVITAKDYQTYGPPGSPQQSPSKRSTPRSSTPVGSPRRSRSSFHTSPTKTSSGISTPVLTTSRKSFDGGSGSRTPTKFLNGGPGGGYGPGAPAARQPAVADSTAANEPVKTPSKFSSPMSTQGTPTGLYAGSPSARQPAR